MVFCFSCGGSLPDGSKFCFLCGASLSLISPTPPLPSPPRVNMTSIAPPSNNEGSLTESLYPIFETTSPSIPPLPPRPSPREIPSTPKELPTSSSSTEPVGTGPGAAKLGGIVEETKAVLDTVDGLKKLYGSRLRPLEKAYMFDSFFSPVLNDSDFEAKPMVLLLGQYSVGKTTFIKYIIEGSFPGERVGPEPTTEKFVAIMNGKEEKLIPGNAAAISADFPFSGLQKFGNAFLNKFEVAQVTNAITERLMLIDTPGVLSGEKQRLGRSYEFSDVVRWFASKADRIILLFDAHKLDISDEFQEAINACKGNDDKVRIVLNKADKVGKQELMRVYGALMWSLGRVITTPEAPRVFLGSFWDKSLENKENADLFIKEELDLISDLKNLPRSSAVRKMNEVVKRARLLRVHVCIMTHLGSKMPNLWGGQKQKEKLMQNIVSEFAEVQHKYGLSPGDFPNPIAFNKILESVDLDRFRRADPKVVDTMEAVLGSELPRLMSTLPTYEKKLAPLAGESASSADNDNPFGMIDAELSSGTWAITASEKEISDIEFHSMVRNGGRMSGEQARDVLMKTGLPPVVLRQIWALGDIDKDGKLDSSEYAVVKRLVTMKMSNEVLPAVLPLELIPPSKRPADSGVGVWVSFDQMRAALTFLKRGRHKTPVSLTSRYVNHMSLFSSSSLVDSPSTVDTETEIARLQRNVGTLYKEGRYDEALLAATEAEKIVKEYFGQTHPVYGSTLCNLALCQKTLGNLRESIAYYEKAMEVYTNSVGQYHPSALTTTHNLSMAYLAISDRTKGMERLDSLERARSLSVTTLEYRKKDLGADHPHVAASLMSLAGIFRRMKKYDDAEKYQREALDLLLKKRGEEHLDTITALNNLGVIVKQKGEPKLALDLYSNVLNVRMKVLGESHPDTISVLYNIIEAHLANGDEESAEEIRGRVMRIANISEKELEESLERLNPDRK